MNDQIYMERALELAAHGLGLVAPNPLVGAVVVKDGHLIGQGFHKKYGASHAEVEALNNLSDSQTAGATLYVNLEPCNHFGKTPPCAALVVKRRIKRVVVAMQDPNPLVAGSGIAAMRSSGIEVVVGVKEQEARALNKRFVTYHEARRPYIILKWAETADGYIDRTRSNMDRRSGTPISSAGTQKLVHLWRSQEMAIAVGATTLRLDNPRLTVRKVHGSQPLRVVLGGKWSWPMDSSLMDGTAPTLIYGPTNPSIDGVEFAASSDSEPGALLDHLYQRGVQSMLVEGGSAVHRSFIEAGLWDEARIIQSRQRLGSGVKAPDISGHLSHSFSYASDQISILLHTKGHGG